MKHLKVSILISVEDCLPTPDELLKALVDYTKGFGGVEVLGEQIEAMAGEDTPPSELSVQDQEWMAANLGPGQITRKEMLGAIANIKVQTLSEAMADLRNRELDYNVFYPEQVHGASPLDNYWYLTEGHTYLSVSGSVVPHTPHFYPTFTEAEEALTKFRSGD